MSEQVIIENKCTNSDGEKVCTKSTFKSTHLVTETQFFSKGTENLRGETARFNFYRDVQQVRMNHVANEDGEFDVRLQFMQSIERPIIGSRADSITYSFDEYDEAKQF
jgi:hypothetical protein